MIEQNGKKLSMHGDAVYKGGYANNGMLLKLHENSYTVGYSRLLSADGTKAGTVKFGNGVFLDLSQKNNNVYAGKPTGSGAVPAFAGIMVREPGIASGYPVHNDEVSGFQNGLLCREGYIVYKKADVYLGTGVDFPQQEVFPFVFQNYCMFVSAEDGSVYFTPKSTVSKSSDDMMVGRVVEINPDDQSVTVYVSPALLADVASITAAAPTVTAGTPTASAVPVTVTVGTSATIKLSYKKDGDEEYTDVTGSLVPVYDETAKSWKTTYTFDGLDAGTEYTFRAIAIVVGGAKSETATATTAAA